MAQLTKLIIRTSSHMRDSLGKFKDGLESIHPPNKRMLEIEPHLVQQIGVKIVRFMVKASNLAQR